MCEVCVYSVFRPTSPRDKGKCSERRDGVGKALLLDAAAQIGADSSALSVPHASQWNLPDTVEPAIEKSQQNIVLKLICMLPRFKKE